MGRRILFLFLHDRHPCNEYIKKMAIFFFRILSDPRDREKVKNDIKCALITDIAIKHSDVLID